MSARVPSALFPEEPHAPPSPPPQRGDRRGHRGAPRRLRPARSLPVQAESRQAPAAAAQRATASERTVAQFFAEYQDAVNATHSEGLDHSAVRKRFLSTELDDALTVWEGEHKVNPVFRRADAPESYDVAETGQADGNAKVVLTQKWEDGTSTDVWYQVGLNSQVIVGLTDPS
ncbi:hypothetical protein ACODT5_29650 [Streptomyces sp. 5.8]|uniref:hypothetical protein n=1 Tax=Streptomyces sp. 5.8 TaxID=3406571 RepID=UPI003BB551C3